MKNEVKVHITYSKFKEVMNTLHALKKLALPTSYMFFMLSDIQKNLNIIDNFDYETRDGE